MRQYCYILALQISQRPILEFSQGLTNFSIHFDALRDILNTGRRLPLSVKTEKSSWVKKLYELDKGLYPLVAMQYKVTQFFGITIALYPKYILLRHHNRIHSTNIVISFTSATRKFKEATTHVLLQINPNFWFHLSSIYSSSLQRH